MSKLFNFGEITPEASVWTQIHIYATYSVTVAALLAFAMTLNYAFPS